ncbi:MAG: hypothetical protein ACJA2W_001324 [Planctomycetota bacterium]|jgi:hypothetical protein
MVHDASVKHLRTSESSRTGRGAALLLIALAGILACAWFLFGGALGGGPLEDRGVPGGGVNHAPAEIDAASDVEALAGAEEATDRQALPEVTAESGQLAEGDDAIDVEEGEAEADVSTVVARLLDDLGGLAVGAELRSIYVSGEPRGPQCFDVAKADGACEIEIPDEHMRHWKTEPYSMTFQASAPMRATSFTVGTPEWHGTKDLGDIILERGGAVRGRIVGKAGGALSGARVYLGQGVLTGDVAKMRLAGPDKDVRRPRAISDADGSFEFPGASAGKHVLYVGLAGKLWAITDPFEVSIDAVREAGTITLEDVPAEEIIRGRVVRPNGQPAAGAIVSYDKRGTGDDGKITADDDGSFVFFPGGNAVVEFVARDAKEAFGMSSPVVTERGAADLVLELTERRVVRLHVVDAKTGSSIERAAVMVMLEDGGSMFVGGGRPFPGQSWKYTDAQGRIDVEVPAEKCSISASLSGYDGERAGPWESVDIPAELRIELQPDPAVEGRVLAYGKPVGGAKVLIGQRIDGFVLLEQGFPVRFFNHSDQGVETDAEGRFSCPVDPEWTELTLVAFPESFASGEIDLTVVAGEGARSVVIEVTNGGAIEGTVTPPPGGVAEGLIVAASNGDGHPQMTRVLADGTYRHEGLGPGPWHVEVMETEPTNDTRSIAQTDEQKDFKFNVDVVDGKTATLDLDARSLAQAELFGTLLIDGQPAAGFVASVTSDRYQQYSDDVPATEVDGSGEFVLQVPNGDCEVHFVGTLGTGHRIEIIRLFNFKGVRVDWSEDVQLGRLQANVAPSSLEHRVIRGGNRDADREFVLLSPAKDGKIDAPSPIGDVWIQTLQTHSFGRMWTTIKVVPVIGD